MNLIKKVGILAGALFLPLIAQAQATPAAAQGATSVPATPFNTVSSVLNFVCTIFGWMFYFLIALAVVFVVVAAFKYLTSSGNAEGVKSANSTLLYAAIAVAVALLAKGIPLIVADFLGAGSGVSACGAGAGSSGSNLTPIYQ